METPAITLTQFLAARLDEDEQRYGPRPLEPGEYPNEYDGHEPGAPARVLREVEAKRALLAAYEEAERDYGEFDVVRVNYLRRLVKAFAAVYLDHPDYRQEWAP